MSAMEAQLRRSGQFGQQQRVPKGATEQERFFAVLGRESRWTA